MIRFFRRRGARSLTPEAGISMIEVLVSISLFGIMVVGVFQSAIFSMRFQKNAELGNLATNLAVSKAEELAGTNASDLDSSDNLSETGLTVTGHSITFDRTTTVTVNSDGSRTIDITVSSPSTFLLSPISYSTRFAPSES